MWCGARAGTSARAVVGARTRVRGQGQGQGIGDRDKFKGMGMSSDKGKLFKAQKHRRAQRKPSEQGENLQQTQPT